MHHRILAVSSLCGLFHSCIPAAHPNSPFGSHQLDMHAIPRPCALSVLQLCSLAMPCYYSAGALLALSAAYFALFFLASNLIVPGGLFM